MPQCTAPGLSSSEECWNLCPFRDPFLRIRSSSLSILWILKKDSISRSDQKNLSHKTLTAYSITKRSWWELRAVWMGLGTARTTYDWHVTEVHDGRGENWDRSKTSRYCWTIKKGFVSVTILLCFSRKDHEKDISFSILRLKKDQGQCTAHRICYLHFQIWSEKYLS